MKQRVVRIITGPEAALGHAKHSLELLLTAHELKGTWMECEILGALDGIARLEGAKDVRRVTYEEVK